MPADDAKPWLFYAMGGGWGHLTRSLSLAQVVARKFPVRIITNSPYADAIVRSPEWQQDAFASIEIIRLNDFSGNVAEPGSARSALQSELERILFERSYSCFVVDTFARGILGELADLIPRLKDTTCVLIHRDIVPEYAEKFELRAFVSKWYHQVLNPGEGDYAPLADLSIRTNPWVLKNNFQNLTELRSRFGIDEEKALVLVSASGKPDEMPFYTEVVREVSRTCPEFQIRFISHTALNDEVSELRIDHWPGIDCVAIADIVIGAGGYNTVNECRFLGKKLIAFPQERLYDRQQLRLQSASTCIVNSIPELCNRLKLLSAACREPQPQFENGAEEAFSFITECLTGSADILSASKVQQKGLISAP